MSRALAMDIIHLNTQQEVDTLKATREIGHEIYGLEYGDTSYGASA